MNQNTKNNNTRNDCTDTPPIGDEPENAKENDSSPEPDRDDPLEHTLNGTGEEKDRIEEGSDDDNKRLDTEEVRAAHADTLSRVFLGLTIQSDEEFYAYYLAMDKDLEIIAAAAKVPTDKVEDCLHMVLASLDPEKVRQMDDDLSAFHQKAEKGEMPPFGLREPEEE